MADDAYTGFQDLPDAGADLNAITFIVRMILGELATATLVQVLAVYPPPDPFGPVGTVDVQPLVNILGGDGTTSAHGPLKGLPYFRLQGGTSAVVIDPKEKDIGLAVFASRDISSVKANKAAANPGSRRQHDMADGLYIGGMLNGAVTRYIQFSDAGINIVDPEQITLQAPTINLKGDVKGTSTAEFTGDVTANGTSVHTHKHGNVQPGTGVSGEPQ